MNNESSELGKWQLSLANVLVFVFALGLWFALFASRSGPLMIVALLTTPVGFVFAWRAWLERRYALLLLACLFELIVVFGGTVLFVRNVEDMGRQYYRGEILASIARGMNLYYADWNAYPPPPADSKLCGTEIARYLSMPRKHEPTQPYYYGGCPTSVHGNELKWELQGSDVLILIDVGNDGVAGKYSVEEKEIKKTPADANQDGIDDGADDAVISGTRGGRD